jgi:hypothetical protein
MLQCPSRSFRARLARLQAGVHHGVRACEKKPSPLFVMAGRDACPSGLSLAAHQWHEKKASFFARWRNRVPSPGGRRTTRANVIRAVIESSTPAGRPTLLYENFRAKANRASLLRFFLPRRPLPPWRSRQTTLRLHILPLDCHGAAPLAKMPGRMLGSMLARMGEGQDEG